MLRLAMVAEHSDADDRIDGGVQAVTKYLIDELTKLPELDVHVISFKYGLRNIRSFEDRSYTRHLVPAARLGAFSLYAQDQVALNSCLKRIGPQVVHSQGAGHYGITALRSPFPAVMTIHGIMSEEAKHITNKRLKFRRTLISMLSDRLCISRAAHSILISPYVATYYGSRLTGRHYHIPNPVADAFFDITRKDDGDRILFAGRLLPLKGVMDLVRATSQVASSRSIQLVLAGSLGDHGYVSKLKKEVARLNIQHLVQFRGILAESELLEEFSRASALVLPSYQETAPMVIQEAMASGLPVIASNIGGIPHQVEEGRTGFLIAPGDVDQLADRLKMILSDAEFRASLGLNARMKANKEYRAETVAGKTVQVYQQMLS